MYMKRKRHGPATTAEEDAIAIEHSNLVAYEHPRMPDPPAESAVAAEAAEAAVTGPICSGKTLMEAEESAEAVIPATGPEAADPGAELQEAEQPASSTSGSAEGSGRQAHCARVAAAGCAASV